MIKLVFCLRRLPHLSRKEFQRRWREEHGLLVQQHAADLDKARCLAKAQHVVETSQTPEVRALFRSVVALLQSSQP